MNSKDRVMTAVSLAEPDRVPMDFQANPWVLRRLHGDLGTTSHRDLLLRLRSDIVDLPTENIVAMSDAGLEFGRYARG